MNTKTEETGKDTFRISLYGMEQYFRLIQCTKRDDGSADLQAARELAVNFVRLIRFYSPKGSGYALTERTYLCKLYGDEVVPLIDLHIKGVKPKIEITKTSKYEEWVRPAHPEVAGRWKDYDCAPTPPFPSGDSFSANR